MPPAFEVRVLSLSPGGERAYDTDEWRDALVVVGQGELELECASGGRRRFRRGSVLWLSGLPLRSLSARGRQTLLLVSISRRSDELRVAGVSVRPDQRQKGDAMNGASNFVWFDLRTQDGAAARDFYAQLLGWDAQEAGGMAMFAGHSGPWAAIAPPPEGAAPAWVPYVQVDDLDEATKKAVGLGATVLQEAAEGPAGRYATIRDAAGAPVALWQARAE
jgi:predicted enzyme related to lactoylglutathione lyase